VVWCHSLMIPVTRIIGACPFHPLVVVVCPDCIKILRAAWYISLKLTAVGYRR
jgi:hypothetical protein